MNGPFFLDTNILVYAALQQDARSDQAQPAIRALTRADHASTSRP
jgi:hypothetical protein